MVMSAGLVSREAALPALVGGTELVLTGAAAEMYRAYQAPVRGLPDTGYNGLRRFPLSIPLDSYDNGNGAAQTHHYRTLLTWNKPVNFIWGCADDVFTEAWGRQWAGRMKGSFDAIPDSGHFCRTPTAQLLPDTFYAELCGDDGIDRCDKPLPATLKVPGGRVEKRLRWPTTTPWGGECLAIMIWPPKVSVCRWRREIVPSARAAAILLVNSLSSLDSLYGYYKHLHLVCARSA